jgi:factor associated with neutral sphingomyelinase activation
VIFSLSYVGVAKFLDFVSKLHGFERSPDSAAASVALARLIEERESRFEFDSTWYVDLSERPQLRQGRALLASQVTPLVETPGRVMLTNLRIYFQPVHNITTVPVQRYALADVVRVYKRRYTMRDVGLEVFFGSQRVGSLGATAAAGAAADDAAAGSRRLVDEVTPFQESIYLSFKSVAQRDEFYDALVALPVVREHAATDLGQLMGRWRRGEIDNYTYLMLLNLQAGRSFNDLTQYPVFPWVLADYESKQLDLNNPATFRDLSRPIGALNPERLKYFLKRSSEAPPELNGGIPFLYGTHYSTPGYVLYFLVRVAADYMLRLQSGRFDAPDRLFSSIARSWHSCLTNPADLKELIPEFYTPETEGAFLRNEAGLDLGVKADGREVDDVELPPWAREGGAREFVSKCREALECDYVSQRLHQWIDLIFGAKQRGSEAVKAHNVFYHLTYEGAVDLEAIQDPKQLAQIEVQVREFGQTPRQLFKRPHPPRVGPIPAGCIRPEELADPSLLRTMRAAADDASLPGGATRATPRSEQAQALPLPASAAPAALPAQDTSFATRATEAKAGPARRPTKEQLRQAGLAAPWLSDSPRAAASAALAAADAATGSGNAHKDGQDDDEGEDHVAPLSSPERVVVLHELTIEDDLDAGALAREMSRLSNKSSADIPVRELTADDLGLGAISVEVLRSADERGADAARGRVAQGSGGTAAATEAREAAAEQDPVPSQHSSSEAVRQPPAPSGSPARAAEQEGKAALALTLSRSLHLHREHPTTLGLSADATTLYAGFHDATLKIYSLAESSQRRNTTVCDLALSGCEISSDAQTVILASWNNSIYVYSVPLGRVVAELPAHDDAVSSISLSADRLASGSWDASVKVRALAGHDHGGASHSLLSVQIWSVSGSTLGRRPLAEFLEHEREVRAVHLSASGALCLSGGEEGAVILWDIRQQRAARVVQIGCPVTGARIANDESAFVVTLADGSLAVIDASSGKATARMRLGRGRLSCLAVQGDLAVAGDAEGILHVWDVASRQELVRSTRAQLMEASYVNCVALSQDGQCLVAGHAQPKNSLSIWSLERRT